MRLRHAFAAVPAAAALAAAMLAFAPAPADSAPAAGAAPVSTAPECVHITVLAYQRGGGLRRIHLEMCGSNGPGSDSPLRDSVNWGTGVLDGATAIGSGCGGRRDPCVIFGP